MSADKKFSCTQHTVPAQEHAHVGITLTSTGRVKCADDFPVRREGRKNETTHDHHHDGDADVQPVDLIFSGRNSGRHYM